MRARGLRGGAHRRGARSLALVQNAVMKNLIASLALVVASTAAGAAPPAPASPVGIPTRAGQNDLTVLASFLTGNWDPKPGEPPVRLRVAEFWKGSPVRWFYLEWVSMADEAKPTRQLVLRAAENGEEKMAATVHRLPGDPARFAGEWRKDEPFASIKPADLREVDGCRLAVKRMMTAHFTAVTEGKRCPGDLPQGPFMRFEFSLASSELALLEQPRDADGNVPKSRLKPFQFGRMSRAPK